MASPAGTKYSLKARVREFGVPPIHDALVIGNRAAIGCTAIRKAIELLVASPFEHIEFKDDVVSDIIVRTAILRRIPKEKLIAFVLAQVKPLMAADEILHLDLEVEVVVEGNTL
ncbi:MAG: hypothetical protein A2140_03410 [Candidatus Muproteobacteria bacterium RBG_16_62_13]|uniref:Uncharacterized protein n=1 Tax=Candidatus Muproteobacteria bacterium RBG_16_62_13 TaxID=1817756 RepID=A0A1F6T7E1_9PROT|nr:MAG: hypothetical protein A2140_03410 [Candidatus Muproteobacteria bacterium RBG_16_62_13]